MPSIDEFQEYSFQYNVKIVGVPEVCSDEAASTTSKLCVKLFKEMGENISIQDIEITHPVPQRNNAGNPKPIVCRFVRRLFKESLMSHRKEISDVTPAAVGLPEGSSLSSARIYDHLSPRMQAVLFQAEKVKEDRAPLSILLVKGSRYLFTKRLHIASRVVFYFQFTTH